MEKKKRIFIIVSIVVTLAIIIGLVVVINSQKKQTNTTNDNKTSNHSVNKKLNNDIVNKENHEYGNTDEHNSNQGRIVTDDEYLYFAGTQGITKQAKKDILEFNTDKKIFSVSSLYLNLYNDYIYFLNMENNNIYRIDKSGNGRTEIANNIKSFYIIDDYIYYTRYENEYMSGIYRMTVDGKNEELLVDYSVKKFYIYGNCMYYIAGENVLAQSDLNGENETLLKDDVSDFKILGENGILYADSLDNNNLYVLSADNTSTRMNTDTYIDSTKGVNSIVLNKDYMLFLPSDNSSFQYGAIKKCYKWIFYANNSDEYFGYIASGNKIGDFEIVNHTMCLVASTGGVTYVNTQGSDFQKIE